MAFDKPRFLPGDLIQVDRTRHSDTISLHKLPAYVAGENDRVYDCMPGDVGLVITSKETYSGTVYGEHPFVLMGGKIGWVHQTARVSIIQRH